MKKYLALFAVLAFTLGMPSSSVLAAARCTAAQKKAQVKTCSSAKAKTKTTAKAKAKAKTSTTKKKTMTSTPAKSQASKTSKKAAAKTTVKTAAATAKPKTATKKKTSSAAKSSTASKKPAAKKVSATKKTSTKKSSSPKTSAGDGSAFDGDVYGDATDPITVSVNSQSGKETSSQVSVKGSKAARPSSASSSMNVSSSDGLSRGSINDQVRTVQVLDTIAGVLAGFGVMLRKLF